jgi:hypothetical protein
MSDNPLIKNFKEFAKNIVPASIIEARHKSALERLEKEYIGKTNSEVFLEIYKQGAWGTKDGNQFFSGSGSHDVNVINPYINSVNAYLAELPAKINAVDLGCGDFNVGQHIRPNCSSYIACDVVPDLIRSNISKFGGDFRCIDITSDDLPPGDIAFIRQVLQHLNNESISSVVKKLIQYKKIVITEHLPNGEFVFNKDKPIGKGIRLGISSGVVVTEPPFLLSDFRERIICEVSEAGGIIRTVLYER